MALIVSAEIDRGAAFQRQFCHAANLRAIVNAAGVFTERAFLSVAEQVGAANVMVMAHLCAAETAEIRLRLIGTSLAV